MAIPMESLERGVYTRLTTHADTSGYTWGGERQNPALPFGRVRPVFGTFLLCKDTDITQPVVQVDYWSASREDALEAISAADTAIRASGGSDYDFTGDGFTNIPPALPTGSFDILPEVGKEGDEITHASARYRFTIQDT